MDRAFLAHMLSHPGLKDYYNSAFMYLYDIPSQQFRMVKLPFFVLELYAELCPHKRKVSRGSVTGIHTVDRSATETMSLTVDLLLILAIN